MKNASDTSAAITVECCGVLEELCDGSECQVTIQKLPVTIAAVIERLMEEYPAAYDVLQRSACAVGDRIVSHERQLQVHERLVLLPPVSGG